MISGVLRLGHCMQCTGQPPQQSTMVPGMSTVQADQNVAGGLYRGSCPFKKTEELSVQLATETMRRPT